MADFTLLCAQRVVVDLSFYVDSGLDVRCGKVSIYKCAEGGHTDGGGLHQPSVTVDAGSLVEPALLQRRVGPHTDEVVAAVVHILRHVIHLRGIAARLATHIVAVEPHAGIAEDAVELQQQVLA